VTANGSDKMEWADEMTREAEIDFREKK